MNFIENASFESSGDMLTIMGNYSLLDELN